MVKNAQFSLKSLLAAYRTGPTAKNLAPVAFGTSGHRGTSLDRSFTEAHILAITQAICEYREMKGTCGPLYLGKDSHALSAPALETALTVLAANKVHVFIQEKDLLTPTPVISRAILEHNARNQGSLADGIVVTPSHNPPEDGGFKYNEPHGGPAGTTATSWIEQKANELLQERNAGVKAVSPAEALAAPTTHRADFIAPYVQSLSRAVDLEAIAGSGLQIGVDPLGGSSLPVWEYLAARVLPSLTVVNRQIDPLFSFMPPDHDGKIRMDCSSAAAMKNLLEHKQDFDLCFGNDPDADRHGIVTPSGLMPPNHFLAVAVWYLLRHRPQWPQKAKKARIGKTAVTTALLDRLAEDQSRQIYETPVGFKWFVDGLLDGSLLFGGEESAGASFLCMDATPWTTDKDGILLCLLAAEITAVTGKNPADLYKDLEKQYGVYSYARIDTPATPEQKARLKALTPEAVKAGELAGDEIIAVYTRAPGNGQPFGGLKVVTSRGWFAARPSGTEDLYKIYAESNAGEEHLRLLLDEAGQLTAKAFA